MTKYLLGLLVVAFLGLPVAAQAQTSRVQGYCEDGNQPVLTATLTSTTKVQRSYPGCTVTVYLTGTLTLATIYSDSLSTPLANPFTAAANGGWLFYAANGHYDVTFSGAGITTPFTRGDIQLIASATVTLGYTDLRDYGAICDGVTNIATAVAAAITAGKTHLLIPPNCFWQPTTFVASPAGFTGWLIPGGLDILGEDLLTSKIWTPDASNIVNYLLLGPRTTVQHVNLNGFGCYNGTGSPHRPATGVGSGCPTFLANNQNQYINTQLLSLPYSYWFDSGADAYSPGFGENSIIIWSRGDGGGIFGNYVGGQDSSAGSAAQFNQAWQGPGGAALFVTRTNDGPGMRLIDQAGSEGVTHTATPTMQFETSTKVHGTNLSMLHTTSTFDGNAIYISMASGSGAFNGNFMDLYNNGARKFNVDHYGNTSVGGILAVSNGADVAAAGTITPTGELFRVTGAGTIGTINPPTFFVLQGSFCLKLIPAPGATWTTTAGGNIAIASTAVVGKMLILCWNPPTGLYYPSY